MTVEYLSFKLHPLDLKPFKYHQKIKDYFSQRQKIWDWFGKDQQLETQLIAFKDSLLKNTYRIDKETEQELYDGLEIAKEKLGLKEFEVTIYQAQNTFASNASIAVLPGEAHIVFTGQLLNILNAKERIAIIAHELGHALFYRMDNGEYEIADRVVTTIANDVRSSDTYLETARIFKLFTEAFCDRASLYVTEDIETTISALVKTSTGLSKVSAKSYLEQANEIFDRDKKSKSEGSTHPENYIRVKSLDLWKNSAENAEEEIQRIITGEVNVNSLDLLSQIELDDLTEQILKIVMKPHWIRTDENISLVQRYIPEINLQDQVQVKKIVEEIIKSSKTTKIYITYILMDFAFSDRDLLDVGLGHALRLAELFEINKLFEKTLQSELKLSTRQLEKKVQMSLDAIGEILESESESIYE